MSTAVAIKLHSCRGEQLRQIAAAYGTSVVGALERFIASEIEAGTIAPNLPGFKVALGPAFPKRTVVFDFEGFHIPDVHPVQAHQIAHALETLANARGRGTDAGAGFHLGECTRLYVGRKGTGMFMKGEQDNVTVTAGISLSFSMARELAAIIRKVANEADGA